LHAETEGVRATRLNALTEMLHKEVPLTRSMGVRVVDYSGNELRIAADFKPNVNIHGTAFGGSLFSICAVASWALLHLQYEENGVQALSVLGDAHIDYHFPVRSEINACCRLPEDGSFEQFLKRVKSHERAAILLTTEVLADGGIAARFQGRYSAFFET